MNEQVEKALDSIRPYLQADGGDVKFVRIRPEGILELQWIGTCQICPMSQLTLRAGVERVILKEVPGIKRVEAVGG
jgi:Fe-S cluster biogenesis protein NfuA